MFESPLTTLPVFPFGISRATWIVAAIIMFEALFVISTSHAIAAPPLAVADELPRAVPAASAAVAVSGPSTARSNISDILNRPNDSNTSNATPSPNDFGARQKALNDRMEQNDYDYGVAVHNCYSRFFVNTCLDRARDAVRQVRLQIHHEQLGLDQAQREAHAQRRNAQQAQARARQAAEAPARTAADAHHAQAFEAKQQQHQLNEAKRGAQAQQGTANQAAYDRKQADFQNKLDQAHRQAAQDAQQRAQRAQSYERKQAAAAQHKAVVDARRKQAAQKAQQQQQQLQQQQQKQQKQEQQDED